MPPCVLGSLNLNYCKLSPMQTSDLLTAAVSAKSSITDLGMARADLTRVPPNVLKKATKKAKINLSFAKFSEEQKKLFA